MRIGQARVEADRPTAGRDRLVELVQDPQEIAEVGMGLGQIGIDADGVAVGRGCFIEQALVVKRTAEVEMGWARSGLMRIACRAAVRPTATLTTAAAPTNSAHTLNLRIIRITS
jgi:hypothetical protein